MTNQEIRFTDGGGYERYMGQWSQLVADQFLEWLAPAPGLRWLDVGCGNGAFTERLLQRGATASVDGVDPSDAQLAYARTRFAADQATFHQGDAMALPFGPDRFDVAVMPLVIFFVPHPPTGVAEMARVVAPGGVVAAYGWDLQGGGFPYAPVQAALEEQHITVPKPPSPNAANLDVLSDLWADAGLVDRETRVFTVTRTFPNFDHYWSTIHDAPSAGTLLRGMSAEGHEVLKARLRELLGAKGSDPVSWTARANAVKGRTEKS